jgi:hypothetical protein
MAIGPADRSAPGPVLPADLLQRRRPGAPAGEGHAKFSGPPAVESRVRHHSWQLVPGLLHLDVGEEFLDRPPQLQLLQHGRGHHPGRTEEEDALLTGRLPALPHRAARDCEMRGEG